MDNPALLAAVHRSTAVIPVFIEAGEEEGEWGPGGAAKWWLHHSLESLSKELSELGLTLILRRGEAGKVLEDLAGDDTEAAIFWNRRYEPAAIRRDTEIKAALEARNFHVKSFNSALLFEPWEVETKGGGPYQVYTPFMKSCFSRPPPRNPLPCPPSTATTPITESLTLGDLGLLPKINWATEIAGSWTPGAKGASSALSQFIENEIMNYEVQRNIPSLKGTSRLSPHLHFGEISPYQIWDGVTKAFGTIDSIRKTNADVRIYLQEILWREFGYHLLFHFPGTPERPLRSVFEHFPWVDNKDFLQAWKRGMTGYPIVDAGMRELWRTGWMHNRVRMIVASFLVKNLLLPWQEGARWFWDTLVDADLASNTLGWQWSAGCGADAAPYFRVFNPVLQGEKFDPDGEYVRTYVPELRKLPNAVIHKPWSAEARVLASAGVQLGKTYPEPIVELSESRNDALKAYATLKAFKE